MSSLPLDFRRTEKQICQEKNYSMLFFSVKGCVITFLCIIFTFYLFVELLNYFLNCVKILIHCGFFTLILLDLQ